MIQTLVRQELLVAAQEVAREKGIDKERVLKAIEESLVKVAHTKYGQEATLEVEVTRQTGEILLFQTRRVVETVEDPLTEISLEDARALKDTYQLEDVVRDPLPSIDFKRVAAQVMRQAVTRLIKEASREREYALYKDKAGEITTGSVKSVDYGTVIVDLGQAEGVLFPGDTISRERFHPGDRIKAYIREVKQDPKGFQIFLSRSHPLFMTELFKQEVPEVYSGVIELRAVARDPGSRAKIAVFSKDTSLDPVGSCVGVRGNRVQAVTKELQDERIDVIRWSEDPFTFLVNALTPAAVTKIIAGDKEGSVQVVVPDDQLSLAIGRRGQNVRLASQLVGMHIDVIAETEEATKRTQFVDDVSKTFMDALGVDDVMARFLVAEGFESVKDIALESQEELEQLESFTPELAATLQKKAQLFLAKQEEEMQVTFDTLGGDKALLTFDPLLPIDSLVKLAKMEIKTKDDLADLSSDELKEMLGDSLSPEQADYLILKARDLDPAPLGETDATPEKDEA